MPTAIAYYSNYVDAYADTGNTIAEGSAYRINQSIDTGDTSPYTAWRVATTTSGTPSSTPTAEYANGFDLGAAFGSDGLIYHIYPSSKVLYYSDKESATERSGANILAYGDSYTLGDSLLYSGSISPYTQWRVAYVTNNTSPYPASLYNNGYDISVTRGGSEMYYVYQSVVCFLEGSQILCLKDDVETYLPIETMRPGFLVKTSLNGYKKVELIGKATMKNVGDSERVEDRLYKLSPSNYPELKEDLFITGAHSILVDTITDKEREELTQQLGQIFVTDGKYRLTAMVDQRSEPWNSEGTYTVWHFALENSNIKTNYGVYANGGLLVETCSINTMRTKSNLTLV
jgi:hypothetical protein